MSLVPDAVLANWTTWWPGRADALAADIERRFEQAVTQWGLVGVRPLASGQVALVCSARRDAREVVLKLTPDAGGTSLSGEDGALTAWSRAGLAPEVLATRDGGLTMLIARVRPGQSLREVGAGADEILTTLGGLLPSLHATTAAPGLASLRAVLDGDGWFRALAGRREHDELIRLTEPGPDDRMLHLDLHWLNVLRGPDGWQVIDPTPALGDPHADVYGFLDGPPLRDLDRDPATAREQLGRRIVAYAQAAELDPDRIATWLRLWVLVRLAQPEGGLNRRARALARIADALA